MLLLLSKTALERRLLKDKKEAEKRALPRNPETNYGLEVAALALEIIISRNKHLHDSARKYKLYCAIR